MLAYVLKRILLLLPTLWLLGSMVFFISKMVPGTFADRQVLDREYVIAVSTGNNDAESAYEPAAKPLFYFSLLTSAEPDTLYRVQPAAHQIFLKSLLLTYGNWPAVAGFYHQLLALQKSIANAPTVAATDKQLLLHRFNRIFTWPEAGDLTQALHRLGKQAGRPPWPAGSGVQIKAAQKSLTVMQATAQPWRNWWPVLAWRGTDNQYHSWFRQVVRGNLGVSYRDQQPVSAIIAEAFGNTLALTLVSLGLILGLGIQLNNWLSQSKFRKWRQPVLTLLYAVESIPLFVMALLLLTIFASSAILNIFPVYGLGAATSADTPFYVAWLYQIPYLVLPVLSLTIVNLPYVTGQIYQAAQQVQQRDFILTAKAKGLSEPVIWRRHVLRNALLPVITLFTGFLPALVSGAVVIEIIYAIPGMGRLLADAVLARDFPVVIGLVLCLGLIKITAHIVADVLYYIADPRIKLPA